MNHMILTTALFVTLCATPLTVLARPLGPPCGEPPLRAGAEVGDETRGDRHFDRLAVILDLTREQRQKIDVLRDAERISTEPYRRQMRESREAIHTLTQTDAYDEAAVRRLARAEAEASIELLVAHSRTRSQIYALLTPQQRTLAERFDMGPAGKRGPGRHGFRGDE